MRLAILVACAIALTACGGVQRTVIEAPPLKTRVGTDGRHYRVGGRQPVVAPVYAHPPAVVLAAAELACDSYCHDVPTVDRAAGTLRVFDKNEWTGSIPLTIQVVDLGDGRTRMDMEAGEARGYIGDEIDLQLKRMRGFIEHVEKHLRLTGARQTVQTGSGDGAATAAAAETTPSATSRP